MCSLDKNGGCPKYDIVNGIKFEGSANYNSRRAYLPMNRAYTSNNYKRTYQ